MRPRTYSARPVRARTFATKCVLTTALGVLFFAAIIPFLWMLHTSVMSSAAVHAWPPRLDLGAFTFDHFRELFQRISFGRVFLNSVIVSVAVTLVSLFFNSLAGYTFAKFEFPFRGPLFILMLLTIMVPGQVSMIPVFILLKNLGLLNNYLGLILPGAVSIFGIFLMRQYMFSVPDAYIESGRIDGCSELRIFLQIVVPLCVPAMAALAIFTFIGAWSDFMMPLIVMQRSSMYTLTVALATLNGQHAAEWGLLMAASVVTILPIAIVFVALQRRFIEGMMLSGVKG